MKLRQMDEYDPDQVYLILIEEVWKVLHGLKKLLLWKN